MDFLRQVCCATFEGKQIGDIFGQKKVMLRRSVCLGWCAVGVHPLDDGHLHSDKYVHHPHHFLRSVFNGVIWDFFAHFVKGC